MAFMLWHAWKMRFIFRLPESKNRGVFLKTAVFAAAGLIFWQITNQVRRSLELPGVKRRFTGSYPRGLEDGNFPVVSWIADRPPTIDPASWELTIDGAVNQPKRLSLEALQARQQTGYEATLDCTGGWYTTQNWEGVALSELLKEAEIRETAVSITVTSTTGYKRRFSLKEANSYLLATRMRGNALSKGHGYPLRLVAHDKRGVEWVKWVNKITVNTSSKHWQSPLPLQ